MSDAIQNKHDQIAALLRSHGCRIDSGDAAGWMCTAASEGDLDQLRRLISNHCDPDAADYDARTAIHLAASNGHLESVKFLISSWANPSPHDRWGGTPLSDAIRHGHVDVQEYLVQQGGVIGTTDIGGDLCQHAVDGEIEKLRTLLKNGAGVNASDYDDRTVSSHRTDLDSCCFQRNPTKRNTDFVACLLNRPSISQLPAQSLGFCTHS